MSVLRQVQQDAWDWGYNWFDRSIGQWWFVEWAATGMRALEWQEQQVLWDYWEVQG